MGGEEEETAGWQEKETQRGGRRCEETENTERNASDRQTRTGDKSRTSANSSIGKHRRNMGERERMTKGYRVRQFHKTGGGVGELIRVMEQLYFCIKH